MADCILETQINELSQKLVALANREIKKSQAESVAFALGSVSNLFVFGDSHNLLAKSGATMDMNSCPLCGTPDNTGFCMCLGVLAKSEESASKSVSVVPHNGKLPSDEKVKEVETGDGNGGEVKKSSIPGLLKKDFGLTGRADTKAAAPQVAPKIANPNDKLARAQSVLDNPNLKGTFAGDSARNIAQQYIDKFGPKAVQGGAPVGGAPAPAMPTNKDASQIRGAPTGHLAGFGGAPASVHAPNPIKPMGATAPTTGQKQISLPGAGMKHAPAMKQQVGGDVISPNPQKAAPGLGSMRDPSGIRGTLMRSEDLNQFEEFKKSEDFDFGTCVLCGSPEHVGDCK